MSYLTNIIAWIPNKTFSEKSAFEPGLLLFYTMFFISTLTFVHYFAKPWYQNVCIDHRIMFTCFAKNLEKTMVHASKHLFPLFVLWFSISIRGTFFRTLSSPPLPAPGPSAGAPPTGPLGGRPPPRIAQSHISFTQMRPRWSLMCQRSPPDSTATFLFGVGTGWV